MRIGTFIGGVVVGAAVTLSVGFIGALTKETPRPGIFSSLPDQTPEIAPAVDRAVKARFPAGTSEDSVVADLSEMGFVIRRGEGGLWADYSAGGSVCTESFLVTWRPQQDRSIEEISADYHLSCL